MTTKANDLRTGTQVRITFNDGRTLDARIQHKFRGWNFFATGPNGSWYNVVAPRPDGTVTKVEVV